MMGFQTIRVCDLNRSELVELRDDYYDSIIKPQIEALDNAMKIKNIPGLSFEYRRAMGLLHNSGVYVGFTFDVFRTLVPDVDLKKLINVGWPLPSEICNL